MTYFKPPQLSKDEIESKAFEVLLAYYGTERIRLPIEVEHITEFYLGYDLVFTDEGLYQDPNFLGGICFIEKEIYINAALENHEGRMAFTIAHEIGHHVLHRQDYLDYLKGESPEILCRDTSKKPLIEEQADQFAASLLLPKDFLLQTWSFGEVRNVYQAYKYAQQFKRKHAIHNVSISALINRLIDLGVFKDIPYQKGRPNLPRRGYLKIIKFVRKIRKFIPRL